MTCLLSAAHWARDTHVSPHVYLCCPGECGPAPTPAPPPRTAPPPTRPHCAPARPRGCCCPAPRALEDVVTTCHVSRVSAAHLTRPRARGRGCAGGRAPGGRQPAPAAGRRPGPGRRSCQWQALGHGSTVYIHTCTGLHRHNHPPDICCLLIVILFKSDFATSVDSSRTSVDLGSWHKKISLLSAYVLCSVVGTASVWARHHQPSIIHSVWSGRISLPG